MTAPVSSSSPSPSSSPASSNPPLRTGSPRGRRPWTPRGQLIRQAGAFRETLELKVEFPDGRSKAQGLDYGVGPEARRSFS